MVSISPLVFALFSTCQDCCRPGGSCGEAFKQEKGICCGSFPHPQCCPYGHACHACDDGLYRCYHPSASAPACYEKSYFLILCVMGVVVFMIASSIIGLHCLRPSPPPMIHPASAHAPMVSGGMGSGGIVTGFLGGMIVSDVLHDIDGMDQSSNYDCGVEADV